MNFLRQANLVRGVTTAFRFASTQQPLKVERLAGQDNGIVMLRMNVPATKNAISKLMLAQLRAALAELKFDPDVRVLVLRSDVPGAFCAGADLKERKQMTLDEVRLIRSNFKAQVPRFVDSIRALTAELSAFPQPTIAALDGVALGGGLEIALSCDLRVASNGARMGLTETRLAIIPGAGGTQRLTRIVGVAKAKELIFTAKIIDAQEAAAIGLVNAVVDKTDGDDAASSKSLEIAREIIQRGPVAIRMAKIAIEVGSQLDLANGLALEQQCYAQVIPTNDRLEGLAAFAEKRPPVYKGN